MGEKAIWVDIARVCGCIFTNHRRVKVQHKSALKQTPQLLGSICPAGYQIRSIEYGKILVMLLYGKYYWHVYEVYNK